ncbi:MAG: helix-turn-helix domain-containing protein, partial [Tannerellaceae bacterium]|nr:helix-turn-helix domain-containing protein [Tannerellaceae bacterium]
MKTNLSQKMEYCRSSEHTQQPLIQVLNFTDEHKYEDITSMNALFFIIEGDCCLGCDIYPDALLHTHEAMFLPAETRYKIEFSSCTQLMVIYLDPFQNLYGSYSIEDLFAECGKYELGKEAGILQLKTILCRFLEDMILYLQSNLINEVLYDIKIKELLFILYAYYDKKELCNCFKPILNNDFIFASFVVNNWSKVKNVKELAELSTYCETGFNKKFKKVFGVTPYKWLNEKKSAKILFDITNSGKTFKQIAEEYNFNSSQQFHDYCIRNFKKSPGSIRKKQ